MCRSAEKTKVKEKNEENKKDRDVSPDVIDVNSCLH